METVFNIVPITQVVVIQKISKKNKTYYLYNKKKRKDKANMTFFNLNSLKFRNKLGIFLVE